MLKKLKKFKIFWTVLAPFYHIISWLIRPNTTLRHGLCGVPRDPTRSIAYGNGFAAPPIGARLGGAKNANDKSIIKQYTKSKAEFLGRTTSLSAGW